MLKDREKILSALREKPLKIFEVMKRANLPNQEACQALLLKMRGDGVNFGRVLTLEDQLHYRRMIVALARTAELMVEIDRVIARHGGWPDAFRGMTD